MPMKTYGSAVTALAFKFQKHVLTKHLLRIFAAPWSLTKSGSPLKATVILCIEMPDVWGGDGERQFSQERQAAHVCMSE